MSRSRLAFWTWLALLAATAASWTLADIHAPGTAVIVVALVKIRLIVSQFMEVSAAPRALGLAMDAWIAVVAVSLIVQLQ